MCRAVILLSTTKTNILPHELILQIRKDHSDYRMNQMGKDLHSKAYIFSSSKKSEIPVRDL